jgi:C1A family cysteine protease
MVAAVERRRRGRRLNGAREDAGRGWHTKGLTGPMRQQGQCGACWAFLLVGAIESAMAIKKYRMLPLSERKERLAARPCTGNLGLVVPLSKQDLINCNLQFEKGCKYKLMTTTFEEEEAGGRGICSEADYPYLAAEGACSWNKCTPIVGSVVRGQVDVVPHRTNALVEALKVQPVTAAMVADDPMFQFYSSGIYQGEGCGRVTREMSDPNCGILYDDQDVCLPDINHSVLVVGYGIVKESLTNLKGFFKVKNSWGTTWGERGFFHLARWEMDKADPMDNWEECSILSLLSYPVME